MVLDGARMQYVFYTTVQLTSISMFDTCIFILKTVNTAEDFIAIDYIVLPWVNYY